MTATPSTPWDKGLWLTGLAAGHAMVLIVPATDGPAMAALAGQLSPAERLKAERFHFEADRCSFIAAHVAAAHAIRLALAPTRRWELLYAPDGKPFVGASGTPPIHVSLSHTRGLAAVACSRIAPIGVDVEGRRALPDRDRLAERILSPREQLALANAIDPDRHFLDLWCRKEAVLKAYGTGIIGDLRDCCVAELAGGAPYSLDDLVVPPGYAGAVSVLSPGCASQVMLCDPADLAHQDQSEI